ncbi:MAG: flagellar motor protein MotD [Rhodanobacter sp.]
MRKKPHEDHINHEAWAIPYADLMTLLLAFFVVMYAVSVVNEGKYRVASESLNEAFNGSSRAIAPLAASKVSPHKLQPSMSPPTSRAGTPLAPINVLIPQQRSPRQPAARDTSAVSDLARMESQVRKALQPLIDKKLVMVRRSPDWLEIEIRTDILFSSGAAQLSPPADGVLRSLASILAPFDNPLRVEGFTDNVPIATAMYPSNWELSAARAATVARLFAEHEVRADRLGIIGWGQVRPVADNATVSGRNQNRRVLVVVMSQHAATDRATEEVEQLSNNSQLAGQQAGPGSAAPVVAGESAQAVPPSAVAPTSASPRPDTAATGSPLPHRAQAAAPVAVAITTPVPADSPARPGRARPSGVR